MDLTLIYSVCLGVGFLFALVSVLIAEGFGGHDIHAHPGHVEPGVGGHEMPGMAKVSPTTISVFLAAFGGFGLIFSSIDATSALWLTIVLSLVCAFAVAGLVFLIFSRIFLATQSSSEGHVAELFGRSATVITPIAPGGVGEIAYEQGGTRYTACARSDKDHPVPCGEKVRIVRVVGSQFYVTHE